MVSIQRFILSYYMFPPPGGVWLGGSMKVSNGFGCLYNWFIIKIGAEVKMKPWLVICLNGRKYSDCWTVPGYWDSDVPSFPLPSLDDWKIAWETEFSLLELPLAMDLDPLEVPLWLAVLSFPEFVCPEELCPVDSPGFTKSTRKSWMLVDRMHFSTSVF